MTSAKLFPVIKPGFFIAFLASCFTGCDLLNSDNRMPVHIQTDKKQYNLNEDEFIEVTITNKSRQTLHYSTCFPKTLEWIAGNKPMKTVTFPTCYCICPAQLKPGETIPGGVSNISMKELRYLANFQQLEDSASYRIGYSIDFYKAFGDDPLPSEFSRSNSFSLTGFEKEVLNQVNKSSDEWINTRHDALCG